MPAIHQGHCKNCGYRTPRVSEGYKAVLLDGPAETTLRHADDDRIVILAHPCEGSRLERIGHTYTSATFQGRLLKYRAYFCRSCGHLYEVSRLGAANFSLGCWPFLAFGLVVGSAGGLWRTSIIFGLLCSVFAAVLAGSIADALVARHVRSRYADRARELDTERRCPKCGSSKAVSPGQAWLVSFFRRLPCPECKSRSVRIKDVGMS